MIGNGEVRVLMRVELRVARTGRVYWRHATVKVTHPSAVPGPSAVNFSPNVLDQAKAPAPTAPGLKRS